MLLITVKELINRRLAKRCRISSVDAPTKIWLHVHARRPSLTQMSLFFAMNATCKWCKAAWAAVGPSVHFNTSWSLPARSPDKPCALLAAKGGKGVSAASVNGSRLQISESLLFYASNTCTIRSQITKCRTDAQCASTFHVQTILLHIYHKEMPKHAQERLLLCMFQRACKQSEGEGAHRKDDGHDVVRRCSDLWSSTCCTIERRRIRMAQGC